MNKVLYYNELFSYYKELLTKKEQEVFSLYYEENLSMGEIAQIKNISRSAVGFKIKKVEEKLDNYEQIIKKYKIFHKLRKIVSKIDNNLIKLELEKIIEE